MVSKEEADHRFILTWVKFSLRSSSRIWFSVAFFLLLILLSGNGSEAQGSWDHRAGLAPSGKLSEPPSSSFRFRFLWIRQVYRSLLVVFDVYWSRSVRVNHLDMDFCLRSSSELILVFVYHLEMRDVMEISSLDFCENFSLLPRDFGRLSGFRSLIYCFVPWSRFKSVRYILMFAWFEKESWTVSSLMRVRHWRRCVGVDFCWNRLGICFVLLSSTSATSGVSFPRTTSMINRFLL